MGSPANPGLFVDEKGVPNEFGFHVEVLLQVHALLGEERHIGLRDEERRGEGEWENQKSVSNQGERVTNMSLWRRTLLH